MLHAVLVTNEFQPDVKGGLGVAVSDLARHLAGLGARVTVVAPRMAGSDLLDEPVAFRSGPGVAALRVLRFPRVPLYFTAANEFRAQPVRRELRLRDLAPDVVHAHSPEALLLAESFAAEGVPVVYTSHSVIKHETQHGDNPDRAAACARQERLYAVADVIVAATRAERNVIASFYPAFAHKVRVLPNGIDVQPPPPRAASGKGRLLFIGRLSREKGLQYLLAALPLIAAACPGAYLDVVGGGREFEFLLGDLIRFLGVEERVRFHGWVERGASMRRWLAEADVVVVPSTREAFGLVALEAMSAGVPLVASRVGGLAEILDDRVATLVPEADPHALAAAVIGVLADPAAARRKAKIARRRVLRFDWARIARRTLRLYERLLAGRRKRGRTPAPAALPSGGGTGGTEGGDGDPGGWFLVDVVTSKDQNDVWLLGRCQGRPRYGYFKWCGPQHAAHSGPFVANELIAARLADALGVPRAEVSAFEFAGRAGVLSLPREPGPLYMWRDVPAFIRADIRRFFQEPERFGDCFVFDVWICNIDRSSGKNVIVHPGRARDKYAFYAIDHGHALYGPETKWARGDFRNPYWLDVRRHFHIPAEVERFIRGEPRVLDRARERVARFGDAEIAAAVAQATPHLTAAQAEWTFELLRFRRERLDELLERWLAAG